MAVSAANVITAAPRLAARPWAHRARGQGLVEYSFILSFIGILALAALQLVQPAISTTLNNVSNSMQIVAGTPAGAATGQPCPTRSPGGSGAALPGTNGCGNGGG